jgi:hypothetical protein
MLALQAQVSLKVGASDGIFRGDYIFGAKLQRLQNPVLSPFDKSILLTRPAAQGVLVYGVASKVPAVVQDASNIRSNK